MNRVFLLAALGSILSGCPQSVVRFPIDAGQCVTDSECGARFCVSSSCVECRNATDCTGGKVCNIANSCVGCAGPSECTGGTVCSETLHLCVVPEDAGCGDTSRDILNCGSCGNVCPTAMNAPTTCSVDAGCGRGACERGYFDFDRTVFGCETLCVGTLCHFVDGGTVTLTALPVQERDSRQTAVSGGSHGSETQTNSQNTNVGQLGEPTPAGSVEQTSDQYKNVGGFNSILHKR